MANETHSLKIGSITYPIYSKGGFIKSTSTDTFYPLVFSNDLGSESGTYRKLNTTQFVAGCKLGNITAPDAGYIKSTGVGTILPASNTTASQNCSMLINGYTNADGKLSAVSLWSGTIKAGKGIFLESTTFKFSISYAWSASAESGPMEYKIGTASKANCYAAIYIVDTYSNTLARSYINLAKTYKHPNINASTTDPGKAKVYTTFENSFTIPELSYANTTGQDQIVSIYIIPFTTNLNWKNREALIPMSSSDIYPRNYVISDTLTPILPESPNPGGGIIIPGDGGDIINPISDDTENTPMPAATTSSGNITNEASFYQNLVVNWSLSKVNTNNNQSVALNNNTIIKNSYGSGLGTSTLINSTNMCFAKNGLWLGVNNEVNHNIINITNKDITLYGQYANLRLTSSTDYPGLEVLPNYNILYEKPNIYISTDTLESSTLTGEYPDFIFLNKSSTVNSRTLEVRPFSSMQYNLGTSTYRWKEINGYNIYKNGSAVSTSDERYKDFIDDINIDFDDIKRIPKKLFTWKEGDFYDGKKIHVGTSAQKVKEIYPELVYIYNTIDCTDINDEKAILGVDYEKMSIIALAAIDKLNENINSIESLLNTIEADIDYNNNKLKSIKNSLSIYG